MLLQCYFQMSQSLIIEREFSSSIFTLIKIMPHLRHHCCPKMELMILALILLASPPPHSFSYLPAVLKQSKTAVSSSLALNVNFNPPLYHLFLLSFFFWF
jgi:hypothetical protein